MTEAALVAFVTLFVTIDPIGIAPIFVGLTAGENQRRRTAIGIRATVVAFVILALFGLAGEGALALIGISMPAFRIAGGVMLFLIAIDMLFERRTERREKRVGGEDAPDAARDAAQDPAIFPLATPLLAGPGALASMILLVGEQEGSVAGQALVFGAMAAVLLSALALFMAGGLIERLLGRTGVTVMTRLLGMLLAALAVQFVLDGLAAVGALPGAA